ncbi:hypothetical protein M2D63_026040, partial [Pseudomonas sp. BJa5]|nr:hypothetical protein [Pseudomonas sp. BGr12]
YTTDGEAPKKSLTDAINNSLSMLGFRADVFLGIFDDRDYVQQRELLSKLTGRNIEPPFFVPFFFLRFFANLLSPSAFFK